MYSFMIKNTPLYSLYLTFRNYIQVIIQINTIIAITDI